jgi:hypothetical protein
MEHKENPFNVVKAGDFTDDQINEFWVDFPGENGFDTLAKPTSTMPMIIKGGKGSGKTHLMRNYSFQLQKLRHKENLISGIQSDGFIGSYMKLGGLNTKRFHGKRIDDETWLQVFSYYMDIWLSQIFLDNIIDVLHHIETDYETELCTKIVGLFDTDISLEELTLNSVKDYLQKIQKEIDFKVNNCLWEPLSVQILISPGKLLFGIPQIINGTIPELKNCVFVYLIDELENLFEFQQRYIQTLIREKELPCSIKVGARSHGIKTYETLAAGEFNKEGSEFELIVLEEKTRENKNYSSFAKKLCFKRLTAAGYLLNVKSDDCLDDFFEEALSYKATDSIEGVTTGLDGKVLNNLKKQLTKSNIILDVLGIAKNLECQNMPIIEKAAVYCFYMDWNKNLSKHDLPKILTSASKEIEAEVKKYLNNDGESRIRGVLDHYKSDFLAQLIPNQNKRYLYSGLKNIIKVSDGFPRSLLTIFKHLFVYAEFNGEFPFQKGKITKKSQLEGVLEAAEWFVNDARMTGKDGNRLKIAISRLSEIFRLNRYADKPRECSLITFSVNEQRISDESKRLIEIATQWSLLLGDNKGRKDRNSKRIDQKYKLNYMLSPFWELPIASRGVYSMPSELINSIFDDEFGENYAAEKAKFKKTLAPPFVQEMELPQWKLI